MGEPYREPHALEEEAAGDVISVGEYPTAVEAEMAREYLLAHGIRAWSTDSTTYNPIGVSALGGSRLFVTERDASQARYLLQRAAKTPATTNEDDEDESDVRCPRCEQTYCFFERSVSNDAQRAAFASPLLALFLTPFYLRKKRWRCHKCLYIWDDPTAGPKRATPLGPDDPKPVFRLRRRYKGTGLFLGFMLMMLVWGVAAGAANLWSGFGPLLFAAGVAVMIVSYSIGARLFEDVCSAPHCRAKLPTGEEECPSCHGFIAGVINFAHEHYSEAARFRRELYALKAEEKNPKKLSAAEKKPKRRKPRVKSEDAAETD